jgi:hypothetical protein
VQATHPSTQGQATGKRNTIYQHPEAKHTTESLIKITGSIPRNIKTHSEKHHARKTAQNTEKRHNNKRQREGNLLTAKNRLYLNFIRDILVF